MFDRKNEENSDSNNYKHEFWGSGRGFLIIALLIVILWLSNFFIMPLIYSSSKYDLSNAGTAGDMFGGITALFSGLAFAGLVTTLFMQRIELALQRSEIKQTREVFKAQQFEATFFGLLKLLNDYVNSIEVSNLGLRSEHDKQLTRTYGGRAALNQIAKQLPEPDQMLSNDSCYDPEMTKTPTHRFEQLKEIYIDTYNSHLDSHLGPYFRLIFSVMRLIDKEQFAADPHEDLKVKKTYAKIFRAQFSEAEVRLLMFNCAIDKSSRLNHLVEKYGLLRHLPESDFKRYDMIVRELNGGAFGRP